MKVNVTLIAAILISFTGDVTPPVYAQGELENVPPTDPSYELSTLNLAEGYEINLFASDPMIEKPIQMTWDEQGRLWIVGSPIYPALLPGQEPSDKVFVLEDTDQDGVADRSTVFADGLLTPTGILVGDGGVYVANSTELLHFKDLDGDLVADTRNVVLRGFGADDTHHIIHSFRWGPDGRMYINQSIYIFSHIETPWGVRRLRQGGIWRFQTSNKKLDVFARGFVNAWGHEFDAYGQSFATDGAFGEGINHLFPNAAFVAAYKADRILKGLNENQPKHAGLAIISGRHFPDSLQGHMITNDFRANKVNRFAITEQQGGYHSRKGENLIWSNNVAFRPVDVSMGPDGALYLVDWYNPIIQHGEVDFKDPRRDRVHGRIWRITAKDRPLVTPPDLATASTEALLEALLLPEAWTRDQARRLLRESGAARVLPAVQDWRRQNPNNERVLLESLWLHQAFDTVEPALLKEAMEVANHNIRAAAVRVVGDWQYSLDNLDDVLRQAINDPNARVRREAITILGSQSTADAALIALEGLNYPLGEFEDYALWYALRELAPYWIPALQENPGFLGNDDTKIAYALKSVDAPFAIQQLTDRLKEDQVPDAYVTDVLDHIVSAGSAEDLNVILALAAEGARRGPAQTATFLDALQTAVATYEKIPTENTNVLLDLLNAEGEFNGKAALLTGHWNIQEAAPLLMERIQEQTLPDSLLDAYLEGFIRLSADEEAMVQPLLAQDQAASTQFKTIEILCRVAPERGVRAAIDLMNELPAGASVEPLFTAIFRANDGYELLQKALEEQSIPATFATTGLATFRGNRQRHAGMLDALIAQGGVDSPPKIDPEMGTGGIDRLATTVKGAGDVNRGREIYERPELACVACHRLDGEGGEVGPDLTTIGAQAPMDYIITSLLKPEVAVKDGYALVHITRKDGSSVTGILVQETSTETILRNAGNQLVTIPANQIDASEIRAGSLMPATAPLLLEREEFIDLVAFLSNLKGESQNP